MENEINELINTLKSQPTKEDTVERIETILRNIEGWLNPIVELGLITVERGGEVRIEDRYGRWMDVPILWLKCPRTNKTILIKPKTDVQIVIGKSIIIELRSSGISIKNIKTSYFRELNQDSFCYCLNGLIK